VSEPTRLPFEQPLGAFPDGTFRVWAPRAERVVVRVDGADHELREIGFGVWETTARGERYEYFLDGDGPFPDPCSRWQPEGLRGPSRVWTPPSEQGPGIDLKEAVLYELHVGTFTREGTFDAAIEHLAPLKELGVTAVEVMPIAEFPGRHGWGYDGVYLSAAHSAYGGPPAFQRFTEAAHAHGLAVILDVVYNHVGASGAKALEAFGPYFTEKHETFWGAAINFDDEDCGGVREWVLQSAEYWVGQMGVDGLRVDAIHAIKDDGATHILTELAARVHAANPKAVVIAESALNDPRVIRPIALNGHGHDAQWADDFHHCVRTLLTHEREGYYSEYGELRQLAKAFHRPFVWDGSYSPHRRRRFGAPANDRDPSQFVVFTQNHDHVGNRALGDRLPHEVQKLAAFAVLLSPFVPMLFQGEEYGESSPFQFFSDHIDEEIATATRDGRLREFAQFEAFAGQVPDPQDPQTFHDSKLSRHERPGVRDFYTQLIAARKTLGEVKTVELEEQPGWLRVRRQNGELAMNFGDREHGVPVEGTTIVIATADGVRIDEDGAVVLPPLSGALIR
jgi:maltooligosyltrehalose trehalohydrolase